MKKTLLLASVLLLCACNTPARIGVPEPDEIAAARNAGSALVGKPPPAERIHAGDTLRIVRNTGEAPSISAFTANSIYELTLFPVLNDGTFSYPYIGSVKAAGLTVAQLSKVLEEKLRPVYRETALTINISQTPGNTVFIGGAVRNPSNLPVPVVNNIEQALVAVGGVNADADATLVALLRQGDDGLYKTYFFDYSKLLFASNNGGPRAPVLLQRGDVVFVPKSTIGNKIDGVNLYFNQLIPFSKSIGLGVNYNLRSNGN